jgi:hypothetical protein
MAALSGFAEPGLFGVFAFFGLSNVLISLVLSPRAPSP